MPQAIRALFRQTPLPIRALIVTVAWGLLAGCAGVSHHSLDTHQARQLEYENRYHATRRACEAQGRTLVINAQGGLSRTGAPRLGSFYFCG